MKKLKIIVVALLLIGIATSITWTVVRHHQEERREMEVWRLRQDAYLGSILRFTVSEEWLITPWSEWNYRHGLNPLESAPPDVVFVHTPGEAATFPVDVIVSWPSEETARSLNALNFWIPIMVEEEGFILPEGIVFPVTKEDLVDDWETIMELFLRLDSRTTNLINNGRDDPPED